MDDDVHHQIEKSPKRGDAAEVKEDRQKACDHNGIDECVVLDRARHPEMAVRDHLHVGQHRQHPRDRENTGNQTRRRGHQRERHRQVEAGLAEGRLGCFGQRVVLRRHDAVERQAGPDRKGDEQIDDNTDRDGEDDGTPDIAVRVGNFGAAVGDGREALEGEDRQRDRCDKAASAGIAAGCFERDAARPEPGRPEQRNAADFENSHNDGEQSDRPVAGDIHEIGEDDQPDTNNRYQNAILIAAKRPQRVGSESARNETLVDHHRQRHQQRGASRNRRRPIGFLQDHPDAARRRKGVRHLDIGVGAERGDNRTHDERDREKRPGQLRDLPGQREDPRTDHDAGAHGHRSGKADTSSLVFLGHRTPFFCFVS